MFIRETLLFPNCLICKKILLSDTYLIIWDFVRKAQIRLRQKFQLVSQLVKYFQKRINLF